MFFRGIFLNNMAAITKAGLQKLTDELLQLKTVKRRELADRLRVAISHGDLSENFDYSDAKEQERFLEQRIRELEHMIGDANVISRSSSSVMNKCSACSEAKILKESSCSTFTT